MSTSKKQVKSLRRSQPDMLDMIDQANMDIDFVESFLDLLCAVGEGKRLEAVSNRSITCLCGESKTRMDAIKMFVRSIPTCDDSRAETAGDDMIKEETAAYGRDSEGQPRWIHFCLAAVPLKVDPFLHTRLPEDRERLREVAVFDAFRY